MYIGARPPFCRTMLSPLHLAMWTGTSTHAAPPPPPEDPPPDDSHPGDPIELGAHAQSSVAQPAMMVPFQP